MRLRRKVNKKAAALAIAAAVAVSVPVSASAVTYKAGDGTVTVDNNLEDASKQDTTGGNSTVHSYQTGSDGEKVSAEQDDKTSAKDSYDKNITIKGDDKTDTTESTGTIVKVEDGVKGANITIDGVDNETTSGGAVEIGSGSDVDLTVKDTDITIKDGKADAAGIKIAAGTEDEHTNVDITVTGDNTIKSVKDNTVVGNGHGEGVTVGGTGDASLSDTYADATISGNGTLNLNGTSTGIDVKQDSTLSIEGGVTVNIDGTRLTEDGDGGDLPHYTTSGRAIMNYGDLTITGEDTKVNINNAQIGISSRGERKDDEGDNKNINKKNGNVTISDGASVTIEGAEGQGSIYVEGGMYEEDGKGDLTINNATVTVKNSKAGSGSIVGQGADIVIENGAKVNVEKSFNAGINATQGADITIKDAGTEVNVEHGWLYNDGKVVEDAGTGVNLEGGSAGNASELTIKDGARLTISHNKVGIGLYGSSNATVAGKETNVLIKDNSVWGVAWYGTALDAEGNPIENKFSITDGATFAFDNCSGEAGFILNYGQKGKKTMIIDKGALVKDTNSSLGNTFRISDGGSVTIEGAEANLDSSIALVYDGSNSEKPLLWIKQGAKVTTTYVWDAVPAKGHNFYITGGTLTLTDTESGGALDKNYMTTLYDNQDFTGGNANYMAWPTNSPDNGDEKVVNFKLTKTELKNMLETLGSEYDITGDKLTFTAYGYDKTAEQFKEYSYVVDLGKYTDTEDIDVWVPAVILDYYYPFDELPDSEDDAIDDSKAYTKHGKYDVIMRGHSIAFATLKDDGTTNDYTTGNMTSDDVLVNKTKTWYYWDAAENDGKGAWKVFSATTPLMVYSRGSSLSDAKPIIGIHTHNFDEKQREEIIPSDCRYHGLAGDPCLDSDCDKLHTVVLPLEDHLWLNKDNISESGLTLTEAEGGGYTDADGNKYQLDENGNLWKITKEATLTEEGEMMLVCINYPDKVDAADEEKDYVPVVDEIITSQYADDIKNGKVKVEYALSDNFTGDKETAHYQVKAIEKLKPVTPVPEKEKNDGDGDDDIVPVVPPVVPVVPAETTETTVPEVVPVAETTTPVVPAEPAAPATPADTTPKLPQTGADWFSAIGMAAAGLALSIGSLFGKGKHEKE